MKQHLSWQGFTIQKSGFRNEWIRHLLGMFYWTEHLTSVPNKLCLEQVIIKTRLRTILFSFASISQFLIQVLTIFGAGTQLFFTLGQYQANCFPLFSVSHHFKHYTFTKTFLLKIRLFFIVCVQKCVHISRIKTLKSPSFKQYPVLHSNTFLGTWKKYFTRKFDPLENLVLDWN